MFEVVDYNYLVAGGPSPMFTPEKATYTQKNSLNFTRKTRSLQHMSWHAILRYAKVSTGEYLVKGKTGYRFCKC